MKNILKVIGQVFWLAGFLSLFSLSVYAGIQVQVEPSAISFGDSFQLTLTQDNPQGGVPDLTGLQADFSVQGTERHVSYSIINGQAQSASQWVITLKPLKAGKLTIPAIPLGRELSVPQTIQVAAANTTQTPQADLSQQSGVALIADVTEKKPFINQEVIYTVRLYNSKRLLDATYQEPQVDNALLIPLGDTKRYQEVRDGVNYVVEEQNYAIFPQKSGPMQITSPVFTALIYDFNSQRISVKDKKISLDVQPVPKKYQKGEWLPAKNLSLTEHYENATQTLEQGSTLTRTITLEGSAIPAELLPELHFDNTDAYAVYPEKRKSKNQVLQGELVGQVQVKVTYLFNKAGKVTLPELRVHWYNTATSSAEVAILPPRSMDISPSAAATVTDNRQQPSTAIAAPAPVTTDAPVSSWPWFIAWFFAIAWIITLFVWWRQRAAKYIPSPRRDKKVLQELTNACKSHDPEKARDALLQWGKLQWPDAPILNLTDLTQWIKESALKKQIHLLSQALYKKEAQITWHGDALLQAVLAWKKTGSERKPKAAVLPPINPL